MHDPVQIVEVLNRIIKLQSDVINDLFLLLLQHITAEEADRLPVVKKINEAAELRNDLERKGVDTDGNA